MSTKGCNGCSGDVALMLASIMVKHMSFTELLLPNKIHIQHELRSLCACLNIGILLIFSFNLFSLNN